MANNKALIGTHGTLPTSENIANILAEKNKAQVGGEDGDAVYWPGEAQEEHQLTRPTLESGRISKDSLPLQPVRT